MTNLSETTDFCVFGFVLAQGGTHMASFQLK
jgi:hypothetical protein